MKAEAQRSKEKDKDKEPEPQAKVPVGQKVQREIIAWFWVALVFLLINGTIGQARVIPSGSMENTLLIGDHLIMSRIGYDAGVPFTNWHVPLWRNPHRQPKKQVRPSRKPLGVGIREHDRAAAVAVRRGRDAVDRRRADLRLPRRRQLRQRAGDGRAAFGDGV